MEKLLYFNGRAKNAERRSNHTDNESALLQAIQLRS
jgi:hypothetical protein